MLKLNVAGSVVLTVGLLASGVLVKLNSDSCFGMRPCSLGEILLNFSFFATIAVGLGFLTSIWTGPGTFTKRANWALGVAAAVAVILVVIVFVGFTLYPPLI